jgi:hypothetical protein
VLRCNDRWQRVVIGGLISSTILTLLILPVLYELVETRFTQRGAALTKGRGRVKRLKAMGQEWFVHDAPDEFTVLAMKVWVGDRITAVICNFSLPVASDSMLQLH